MLLLAAVVEIVGASLTLGSGNSGGTHGERTRVLRSRFSLSPLGALAFGFVLAFGLVSRRAVERMWDNYLSPGKEEPESKAEKPDRK